MQYRNLLTGVQASNLMPILSCRFYWMVREWCMCKRVSRKQKYPVKELISKKETILIGTSLPTSAHNLQDTESITGEFVLRASTAVQVSHQSLPMSLLCWLDWASLTFQSILVNEYRLWNTYFCVLLSQGEENLGEPKTRFISKFLETGLISLRYFTVSIIKLVYFATRKSMFLPDCEN